jgi:hypothetical protein
LTGQTLGRLEHFLAIFEKSQQILGRHTSPKPHSLASWKPHGKIPSYRSLRHFLGGRIDIITLVNVRDERDSVERDERHKLHFPTIVEVKQGKAGDA